MLLFMDIVVIANIIIYDMVYTLLALVWLPRIILKFRHVWKVSRLYRVYPARGKRDYTETYEF